jgi:hypothetical protein
MRGYVRAGLDDFSGKFVSDDAWRLNVCLSPFVPSVYVVVSSTNRCDFYLNEYFMVPRPGLFGLDLHQARFRANFRESLHNLFASLYLGLVPLCFARRFQGQTYFANVTKLTGLDGAWLSFRTSRGTLARFFAKNMNAWRLKTLIGVFAFWGALTGPGRLCRARRR